MPFLGDMLVPWRVSLFLVQHPNDWLHRALLGTEDSQLPLQTQQSETAQDDATCETWRRCVSNLCHLERGESKNRA